MNEKLIEDLKKLAQSKCAVDDEEFMANDWYGGNMDDAFWGGHRCGEINMAREILDKLGIDYKK